MLLVAAPVISFITIYLQLTLLGSSQLNLTLAMSLMLLTLPLHTLYVLGQQAGERLPVGLKSWYLEIEQQLISKQVDLAEINTSSQTKSNMLTYMDLAKILNILFTKSKL